MIGSRYEDESPRRRARRDERRAPSRAPSDFDYRREDRARRHEPDGGVTFGGAAVTTASRPTTAPKPSGPRITAVIESYDPERRFGFAIDPKTDERFYVDARDADFELRLGLTIEFTAIEEAPGSRARSGQRRVARSIVIAAKELTRPVLAYVLHVTNRVGFLKGAGRENRDIMFPLHVWPEARAQQECIAHVIETVRGIRAVRIDPCASNVPRVWAVAEREGLNRRGNGTGS